MTNSMLDDLLAIRRVAEEEISSANDLKALEDFRVQYLGKKGELTKCLKSLGKMAPEERTKMGQAANEVKESLKALIDTRESDLQSAYLAEQIASETVDFTLPGRKPSQGNLHPITKVRQRIQSLFEQMGFKICTGPEIEDDYHNFTALNIPAEHPARAMQDTFYFGDGKLLRTHMSTVQIREMEKSTPPLRLIATGRVYRHDFDVTHTPMFHQLEGLMVQENLSFADLKGVLMTFLSEFFETDVTMRLRPSYFPFTEPSAEADIQCVKCSGKGCRICSNTGWLEVFGCGMVHPNVLKNVGIDPEKYTGFAFGVGIDRLAMLRYGIDDLRIFFENDLRFLQQF